MIGTSSETIKKAEDRLVFKETMEKIGEPCAPSEVCTTLQGCIDFAQKIGFPVVIRPAYTLGGSGGGIAHNMQELHDIATKRSEIKPGGPGSCRAVYWRLERD